MSKLKYTSTAKLSEAEWQSLRQTFVDRGMVGGSDASTLLGLNKYKSEINMFYQSVGVSGLPNKMNAAMLHGKQLEDYVAKCWQYWDGTEEGWVENTLNDNKIKSYKKVRSIIENPKYPVLFANIDGKITKHPIYGKKGGVLEIKTISGYSADSYEMGIPPGYLVQLQHYMMIMELSYGEIMYLKDGRELGCITFDADKELQQRIVEKAVKFNERVMAAKKLISNVMSEYNSFTNDDLYGLVCKFEPPADNSDAFADLMSEKHKAREEVVAIMGDDEYTEWANKSVIFDGMLKDAEKQKRYYHNAIKQRMEQDGVNAVILPDDGKITWRKQFKIKL